VSIFYIIWKISCRISIYNAICLAIIKSFDNIHLYKRKSISTCPADTSMQMVAIGFIISVIQDSLETALNSSSDVAFTATAEKMANSQRKGEL